MAKIHVERSNVAEGYEFDVTIQEGQSQTRHRVTLEQAAYERLAAGKARPEALVRESFRFLLEREPKESILQAFDLTVIGHYFPEYEREITGRL